MRTDDFSSYELTEERWLNIVREQGKRIEAQRSELSKLNRIAKRDVESTGVLEATAFLARVIIRKIKIW